MSSMRELLATLAVVKLIRDHLTTVEADTKAALKEEVGGRMGATGAILPTGEEGATVSITKPTNHPATLGGDPYVDNPRAFLDWCRVHNPAAIVESVRSSDQQVILARAKLLLEETGELPDGVALTDPTPASVSGGGSVTVRQSEAQAAAVVRAWHAGGLVLPDMLPSLPEAEREAS